MDRHDKWKTFFCALFGVLLLACAIVSPVRADSARHYVFFGSDRERIHDAAFLATEAFAGAQLKYTWKELEPEPDAYDFRALRTDLAFLTAHGKRLFVQLQDVTFDPKLICVPNYLRRDPRFHGGADKQYEIPDDDEARAIPAGWVARRWDKAVQARLHKLLLALGKAFDGKIEGINLAETAVDFGASGRLFPRDFTPAGYRDAIIENMAALKRAFPHSATMIYANFMPGEWLPGKDRGYLRSVYRRAQTLGVGVGGPDLLPYRPGQLHHSYPLIRAAHGRVPTGIAVQDDNCKMRNPKTGQMVTIASLNAFANNYLRVKYIFWGTQEPYYSRDLLPFLNSASNPDARPVSSSRIWRE